MAWTGENFGNRKILWENAFEFSRNRDRCSSLSLYQRKLAKSVWADKREINDFYDQRCQCHIIGNMTATLWRFVTLSFVYGVANSCTHRSCERFFSNEELRLRAQKWANQYCYYWVRNESQNLSIGHIWTTSHGSWRFPGAILLRFRCDSFAIPLRFCCDGAVVILLSPDRYAPIDSSIKWGRISRLEWFLLGVSSSSLASSDCWYCVSGICGSIVKWVSEWKPKTRNTGC